MKPLNLDIAAAQFSDHWSPKTVARINNYEARIAKVQGEFVWHQHDDTDELFLVLNGELTIQIENQEDVVLGPNDIFVVPQGVRHCPKAKNEALVLLLEPASVVNTADAGGERTAVVGDLTE